MDNKHWNRHNDADRLTFARLLSPLVLASRTKQFSAAETSVYLLTLADIPQDLLVDAVSRLLAQGITWMPKPGDVKAACADIRSERRDQAARVAAALYGYCEACHADHCPHCHGSGWADAEGPNAVVTCRCKTHALTLMKQAGDSITRPALPADDPEPAA